MNGFKKAVFAATIAIAGFAASAHAALIGDSITLTGKLNGSTSTAVNATIGNEVEFSTIASYLNFNFDQSTLTITVDKKIPKDHIFSNDLGLFTFSGFNDQITGLTVFKDSPRFNNFDAGDFVLGANGDSFTLNFAGVQPQNDQATLIFNIVTSTGGPATSVPEPTTVALLGLGLLGFAASRRKSSKNA